MLDLDIFEEDAFEAVANNAMSKFLPTNADEFFDWYLGFYAKNNIVGLSDEQMKIISDVKKYYKIIENSHIKDITCYVNKDQTISSIEYNLKSFTHKYAEKTYGHFGIKAYYDDSANNIIYNIIDDILIRNAVTGNDEHISESEFFQFIIDNYVELFKTEYYIPTADKLDIIKSYISNGYLQFRKMKKPYTLSNHVIGGHYAYSINKSLLVKSTISNLIGFKSLFSNILCNIRHNHF